MNTPALDKRLEHHDRTCTYFLFSGDRHCSCGRDEAIKELQALRAELEKKQAVPVTLFTFAQQATTSTR